MSPILFAGMAVVWFVCLVPIRAGAADEAGMVEEGEQLQAVEQIESPPAADSDKSGGFLSSYDDEKKYPRQSFSALMLRLVLSMAVILGLIYGALMLFRLLARKAKIAPKSEKLIRIVDRTVVDQRRSIVLVKVVDRLLVVGVGTNELNTLAQIDDETIVENVQETEFSSHLQTLFGRLAGQQK